MRGAGEFTAALAGASLLLVTRVMGWRSAMSSRTGRGPDFIIRPLIASYSQ
jgi:hypothetical protein